MDSLGWRHKQAIVNKTDNGIYIGYIHGDNNIFVVNIVDGKAGYNSFPIYDYKDEKKTENYFIEDYLLESNKKLEQKAGIVCDSDLYSNSLICSDRSLLSAVAYIKALYERKVEKNSTMHYPAYIHDSLEDIYANFGSMLDDKCSNNNSYDECMEAILSYENVFKYTVWNKLYRREIFDTLCFEVGKLHEDVFFTYQAFGKCKCIIKIDDCLYYYRQRSGSIMGSSFSIRNLDSMEARKRQYYYIKENYPELSGKAQSQVMGNCLYFGQKAVLCLDTEVREKALQMIVDVYEESYNSQPIHEGKKQKFWYDLAKWNFRFCCKIRNWLKIGL